MKYPSYFEIKDIEGLKAFLLKDPGKRRFSSSDLKKKDSFLIGFKMTNQYGRMGEQYKCLGFEKEWNGDRITKLMFRKVEWK